MTVSDSIRDGLLIGEGALAGYLDGVAEANVEYFEDADASRDASEAHDDLYRLSQGRDARYDLAIIGDFYAAWYQLRRVVHAVGALKPLILGRSSDIDIVDIGSGTGATAWAVAVIERARLLDGGGPRTVRIIGVDGSPFMAQTAQELWQRLEVDLSADVDLSGVQADFATASWRNFDPSVAGLHLVEPTVVGGYVLDHSDEASVLELAEDLDGLLAGIGAQRVEIFGAASKQATVHRVVEVIASASGGASRWEVSHNSADRDFVPGSGPESVRQARRRLLAVAGVNALDKHEVAWGVATESGCTTLKRTGQSLLPLGRRPTIVLDTVQAVAARPDASPTLILGAAGSGKSEVLVRRIVSSIETAVRGKPALETRRRILVTAFNKFMVDHLVRRVEEELASLDDPLRINYAFCVNDCTVCKHAPKDKSQSSSPVDCTLAVGAAPRGAVIRFLNWDKVFTRVLGAAPIGAPPGSLSYLRRALPEDGETLRSAGVSDAFLEAEFLRVIYGQRARTLEEYEGMTRRGRSLERIPRTLRAAVWRTVDPLSERRGTRGFTNVRYDAWHANLMPEASEQFDEVIVDEGQDLTEADFEVLSRIVRPSGSVLVALDPAQSQQLGASFRIPGRWEVPHERVRRNWTRHELSKTHRLSISISTAIRPMAEAVRLERGEMSTLEPRKSSVIGARPIIVAVSTEDDVFQVARILQKYEKYFRPDFGDGEVSSLLYAGKHPWYAELDEKLREWSSDGGTRITEQALDRRSVFANGEWKGLEFDAVVWLTGAALGQQQQTIESHAEWIYTVVSRPRSLLVIAITPDTDAETRRIIKLLDRDALHFWDQDAAIEFAR